jgi:hypothetical protein
MISTGKRGLGMFGMATAWLALAAGLAGADSIRLSDGSVLRGQIVERNDSIVIIETPALGRISLPAARVPSAPTAADPEKAESVRDPSDQALFFLPTAFTPPARSFTFRDFELFFLTLGYSSTDATSFTGGFLFPISSEVQVLTFGFKQRVIQSQDGLGALAVTGNFTKPIVDGSGSALLINTNLVAGKRTAGGAGVHAALGYLGAQTDDGDWNGAFSFGFGAEGRLTPHVKALAEFVSAVPAGKDFDINGGLLTLGIRLHGDRLAADIAGTRPMIKGESAEGLLFWPLLVVSYRY